MIKKTLLTFTILFIGYTGLMMWRPDLSASQHQQQTNIINAQRYLYSEEPHDNVIVGSSLSTRLRLNALPGYTNLAFGGLTSMNGLNIVQHGNSLPSAVFIETNVLQKPEDQDFNTNLFSPFPFYSKKYIVSLRDNKKPLAFTEIAITTLFPGLIPDGSGTAESAPASPKGPTATLATSQPVPNVELDGLSTPPRSAIFQASLDNHRQQYTTPNYTIIDTNILVLQRYVNDLTAAGVEVFFFEMPVHNELQELPMARYIRDEIRMVFPDTEYHYIELPGWTASTTDGLHLAPEEAVEYTNYFKQKAALLQNSL